MQYVYIVITNAGRIAGVYATIEAAQKEQDRQAQAKVGTRISAEPVIGS